MRNLLTTSILDGDYDDMTVLKKPIQEPSLASLFKMAQNTEI